MKLPTNDYLKCSHLADSAKCQSAIKDFSVPYPETGKGLELYLKNSAIDEERERLMRTYLVWHKPQSCIVGYFSLKAGLVSFNETISETEVIFDTLPGVELANFAVNKTFVEANRGNGLGKLLFLDFIAPIILRQSEALGIYMLYLFALPYKKLISTYESYGFRRLSASDEKKLHRRLKPVYDKSCIFMYLPLSQLERLVDSKKI